MTRIAALIALTAASGCFYTADINDRPATSLAKVTPTGTPFRAEMVTIEADSIDPNGDPLSVSWSAYACAAGGNACESAAYASGVIASGTNKFTFEMKDSVLTRSVKIVAHTTDSFGAPSLQPAELTVDVANHPPEIDFSLGAVNPPGGPTQLTASATDLDDRLEDLTFSDWQIIDKPFPSVGTLTFIDSLIDADSTDETYELVPDAEGVWEIQVSVTDPIGTVTVDTQQILIGTDQPPCIVDLAPNVPPPGNTMPLDQLRRFEVLVVEDDLDLYPAPPPDDPFYGPATFTWYLASPASGGAYVELAGSVDSSVELDPAAYDPGDELKLRVEIADRIPRTLPCPIGQLSCAIDPAADPPCFQRRTWSVEVQ